MMRTPAADPGPGGIGFSGGTWRSLVAHLHGVQGVPSSNLGIPTNSINKFRTARTALVPLGYCLGYARRTRCLDRHDEMRNRRTSLV